MKKVFFFIGVIFFSELSFSQSEKKNILTFSGIEPIFSKRFNLGYIREINEKIWLGTSVGISQNIIGPVEEEYKNHRAFEIRPEVLYSLAPKTKAKHFVSLEGYYINVNKNIFEGRYFQKEGYTFAFDFANYRRKTTGLNLNYSCLLNFNSSGNFGLMPKIGFGLRNNMVEYYNVQNPREVENGIDDITLGFKNQRTQGSTTGAAFVMDVKLFYRF